LLSVAAFAQKDYNSKEQISKKDTLNTTFEKDEVVAIGYGTRKKSHNTMAIGQIKGKEIAAIQTMRVDDALAGKLSGVLIQNQDGGLGAAPKIQIRAASSISVSSSPLIIVDGYPISDGLAAVNLHDIESLEVLKDAASAAIYGSRAADGVILVTTKKGKLGKAVFNYDTYLSTSQRYVTDNVNPTAAEWANTVEANVANGTFNVSEVDPAIYNYRLNALKNSPDVVAVEDWLFRNGSSMNHNFNVSGATKNIDYFASIGYLNAKDIVITQGLKRYNARLNFNIKLGKRFKTGINVNGFLLDRDILAHDQRDLLRAYSIDPIHHTAESIAFVQDLDRQAQELGLSPFDDGFRGGDAPFNNSIYTLKPGMTAQDWHYGRSGNGIGGSGDAGPATKLENTDQFQKTFFGNFNSYLQFSIIDGLNLKTVFGGDSRDSEDYFWRGREFDSRGRGNQSRLSQTDVTRTSRLSETTLNYKKVLGKHDLDAIAGVEFQKFHLDGFSRIGTNLPFDQAADFDFLAPADISTSERDETIARRSVFGRINYAYDNRYLASVSVRRVGDSRFTANNKFQTFPAFSLGWNVHNEAFYKSDFLSGLKLRFSYGTLGTTSFLGAYSFLSLLPPNITSPELKHPISTETNYGIKLGFFKNRLSIGVDYYTSKIENILLNQAIVEGIPTIFYGALKSSGMEFDLGAKIIDKANLSWNVNANLSTASTKITNLGGLDELAPTIYGQSGRGPVFRNYVGGEIGEMWGLETTGLVEMKYLSNPLEYPGQESGYSYIVDQQKPGEEGHGEIDPSRTVEEGGDLVKIGQNAPDFYWGLSSQVSFKSFDFSLQLQGVHGGEVYNIDPLYYGSQWGRALRSEFDANDDGLADHNEQPYDRNRDQTDAMIQDASYTALRNVTLGYTIKPNVNSKIRIASLRVYLAATNLLYLMADDYSSFNPEGIESRNSGYLGPTTYGVQVGASPTVRSFTAGVNLKF